MRRLARLFLPLLAVAATPAGFDPFHEATIVERPGAPIPVEAPLVDQQGAPTTLARIAAGRPLVLVPVLHACPNICGVTLAGLADAIGRQTQRPGADFALVAFGIDPREGPADARADLARLHAARPDAPVAQMIAVTGPPASIRVVTDALGYRYAWDARIGQYAHIAAIAVLTPDGHMSSWLYGVTPTPQQLDRALDLARQGGSGSLVEQLLLLCFHFDPATGRYSLIVARALQIAGFLTVGGMALLLWRLRRRQAA